MDRMNRLLCEKMQTAGCQVAFKSADSKWIFIRSVINDSDEQRAKLEAAGVGVEFLSGCAVYYYLDEWELRADEFHAKKQTVKSVPIVIATWEPVDDKLITLSVKSMKPVFFGATIDLTDFYGVICEECIAAHKVIIGDHVRFRHYVMTGIITDADYLMVLLEVCSMYNLKLSADEIVIIGEEPIRSMGLALQQSPVKVLDMSKANLTKCKNFTRFCDCAVDLCDVKANMVLGDVDGHDAFGGIGLGPEFRASLFGENLEDFGTQEQISMIDTDDFKIFMSETYKQFCFDQYPEYEAITFKYRRELDPYVRWYAFLFRKGAAVSEDAVAAIRAEFPDLDAETRKKIQTIDILAA